MSLDSDDYMEDANFPDYPQQYEFPLLKQPIPADTNAIPKHHEKTNMPDKCQCSALVTVITLTPLSSTT